MGINNQFRSDVKKGVAADNSIKQVLSPGTTDRRWIPPGGLKRHNEKIHRESKFADDHKNLPFSFSKPKKPRGISTYVKCDNCGHVIAATSVTVGLICPSCKKFSSVSKVT
jgi:hypothetical protein